MAASKKKNAKKQKTPARQKTSVPVKKSGSVATSIAPWLNVRRADLAIKFYEAAFRAVEVFRTGAPDSPICRLSVEGAEFWVGDESPEHFNFSPESLGGGTVRIILTVSDPDAVFARAVKAGAKQVYPVHDEYGWRIGRVADPFGHHWEIGKMLE